MMAASLTLTCAIFHVTFPCMQCKNMCLSVLLKACLAALVEKNIFDCISDFSWLHLHCDLMLQVKVVYLTTLRPGSPQLAVRRLLVEYQLFQVK